MAGALTISTLNNDTGVLQTQNGMTGIAKAWVRFTSNSNAVIVASYNVSSVTYNATGNYTINFTTSMPDANYAPQVAGYATSAGRCTGFSIFVNSSLAYQAPTTSNFIFQTAITPNTNPTDASYCSVVVNGN
jgi:hypothetical protein